MAYLEAYELVGEDYLLKAARVAAECLIQGQLRTGGWRESIEFDPAERKTFAYRVEKERERQNNHTTFDDDKTQSAMRLLMRLDQALKFKGEKLHEASLFALPTRPWAGLMIEAIALDSGPVGRLVHPRHNAEPRHDRAVS